MQLHWVSDRRNLYYGLDRVGQAFFDDNCLLFQVKKEVSNAISAAFWGIFVCHEGVESLYSTFGMSLATELFVEDDSS